MTTSATKRDEVRKEHIPDMIINPGTGKRYLKGRFLGKGGFAKCYELQDIDTKEIFAGKIMTQEISIHREIGYKHVVKFQSFFEDSDNVYILLELCRRRSMMELHKRRKAVTEPEARYFVRQVVLACQYLHGRNIIHRDLKLGNLFINDDMDLKVGDFGLATRVDYDGERKRTLCGTPNYIAPEVLGKKGHSFEVDNEYHIPSRVSPCAKNLIQKLLRADPTERPGMEGLLDDEFFTSGYLPSRLPTSCLTMAPRFDTMAKSESLHRRPLLELNGTESDEPTDFYLGDLFAQLAAVVAAKPAERINICEEEAEDPAGIPIYWVSKWVDYSDKYGLGYQLSDNSVGVLFNDSTRLILLSNGENYMSEHLLKAGANITRGETDDMVRLPFLRTWFRTRSAIVLHLSNGTLQAVTYIDEKRDFRIFKFSLIEKFGCSKELASRLRYAKTMVERLMTTKSGSGRVRSSAPSTAQ
ncbi:PLK1-like protein [Mya arenaria]|uniref:Serine/threonine-protein kinase PLK n=1 Tax=Mya arenaria TaxID=6604 RepID=A0ABY7E0G4_MYAAR|nr:PLK1-like protein [Mya arenaria]